MADQLQTQLELPSLQIERYLDLLRRRRWQVLPLGLLGLLVGAVVAFLIPRYYTVSSTFHYSGRKIDRMLEDPLAEVVAAARVTIPATLEKALDELAWSEYVAASAEKRRSMREEILERLRIYDTGISQRGRTFTTFEVAYSDVDGQRAADLVNTLIGTWVREQEEAILAELDAQIAVLNSSIAKAGQAVNNARTELRTFLEANRIDPEQFLGARRSEVGELAASIRTRRTEIERLDQRISTLEIRLDRLRQQRDSGEIPRTVIVREESGDEPLRTELTSKAVALEHARRTLENITENHERYASIKRQRDKLEARVKELLEDLQRTSEREEQNPVYLELAAELADTERELAEAQATREQMQDQLDELLNVRKQRPVLFENFDQRYERVEEAKAEKRELEDRLAKLEGERLTQLHVKTYEILEPAWVPPRPTDPNITVVALIGSVIGLGLAIMLILLLDVLASTYKTVEDVERALPLPVLGGMSHLETEEQRAAAAARRARISLVAGAFLILMVSVVTIYYVAPTRLPGVVLEALDMVLGDRG